MIEKIKLTNFQNHAKLEIQFGMVTTLVGPSDSGKTAIIRALMACLLNKPVGKHLIRQGKDTFVVKIKIDNHVLSRIKGSTKNQYQLGKEVFHALGTNQPEEIAKLVNLTADQFQRQLDGPFWLLMSGGKVAQELNKIVDLSAIDTAKQFCNNRVRNTKAEIRVLSEQKKQAEVNLASMSRFPELDKLFTSFKGSQRNYEKTHRASSRLDDLVSSWEFHNRNLKMSLMQSQEVSEVVRLGDLVLKTEREVKKLSKIIQKANKAKKLSSIVLPDLSAVIESRKKADTYARLIVDLQHIIETQKQLEGDLLEWQKQKTELELRIQKELQGKCPLCQSTLSDTKSLLHSPAICTSATTDQPSEQEMRKRPVGLKRK